MGRKDEVIFHLDDYIQLCTVIREGLEASSFYEKHLSLVKLASILRRSVAKELKDE